MKDIIKLLKWDSDFFGITTGKTTFTKGMADKVNDVMSIVEKENIHFLYHFQDPNVKKDLYVLNNSSFYLTDEKITLYQKIDCCKNFIIDSKVKTFKKGIHLLEKLYDISYQISEKSRYSSDLNIPYSKVKELYRLWIYNGINSNFCDETFIYEDSGDIKGFVMIKLYDNKADISLIGVDKNFRNQGIATKLITACKNYCVQNHIFDFYVDTQFKNIEALNLYIKNGFSIYNTLLVYHYYRK